MRIQSDQDPQQPARRQSLPPPPNYGSRRVQLRLLGMILAFGVVLWLMNEARKPSNWEWFTALDEQAANQQPDQPEPDTRFRSRPQPDSDPPGVIRMGDQQQREPVELPPSAGGDARSLAEFDAWKRALAALDADGRLLLDRLLLASRGRAKLLDENAERRKEMIGRLHSEHDAFLSEAFQAVVEQRDNLSDEEKESWLTILREMEAQWTDGIQPALMAVSTGMEVTGGQQALLQEAQATIDRIDLASIVDNTVHRPSDRHAWFRLLEQLENHDQQILEAADVPDVGFVELFEQPDNYRGELVRIAGELKMAKRVRPVRNALGIEEYYMFWIKPDGSNSPLAIYTLEVPEGFPELTRDGVMLDDMRATFTGYFFKRWVYPAGDGPRITPLLLAKAPTWSPEPPSEQAALPSTTAILIATLAAALIGIACAAIAFRAARVKSSNRSPYNTSVQQAPERLAALEQQPAPPTVGEKLEQFISGERGGDS